MRTATLHKLEDTDQMCLIIEGVNILLHCVEHPLLVKFFSANKVLTTQTSPQPSSPTTKKKRKETATNKTPSPSLTGFISPHKDSPAVFEHGAGASSKIIVK